MAETHKEATEQRILRITDVEREPLQFLTPIGGYEEVPLVSLEEAVVPLVSILPAVQNHAYVAKQRCKNPPDDLSVDESASIMLYTMGWQPLNKCLHFVLNEILRSPDRQQKLGPWYLFMRLFVGALFRLPPIPTLVFRGVKLDLSKRYIRGSTYVWWGFSSCTTLVDVLQQDIFLGSTGDRTIFTLQCQTGRNIRKHSYFPTEDEVLLLAGTQFEVKGYLHQGNLHVIQLEETIPPFPLLQRPLETVGAATASSTKEDKKELHSDKSNTGTASASMATTSEINTSRLVNQMSGLNINPSQSRIIPKIPVNARWKQNGVTVAGGSRGSATNQLNQPCSLFVDEDQTVIVADRRNNRIIQWKKGDTNGQVIAGDNGQGHRLNQLNHPADVVIDKKTTSLIISDKFNERVVKWSLNGDTKQGEILIDNIGCYGLAMDDQRYLYVSDYKRHEVRQYRLGYKEGTVVAGGNGKGHGSNQLDNPTYLFVDREQNIYVSDNGNHRVMKWNQGAKEGIVVAGGKGRGETLAQFSYPKGIFVDILGTLYVVDSQNNRVMRWSQGDKHGTKIVGGNGEGAEANQLNFPVGLSFDRHGNLYVVDQNNNRIQRFDIE